MNIGFVGSLPPIKDGIADHNYSLILNLSKQKDIKKIICYSTQSKVVKFHSKKIVFKKLPIIFNYHDFMFQNDFPDLYHLQFGNSFPNSFVLRSFKILIKNKQKVISTLHDKTNISIGKIYRALFSSPTSLLYDFEKLDKNEIIRNSSIVIVYSEYLKNILGNSKNIKTIFHGGQPIKKLIIKRKKSDEIKIVSFGFITPRKGFEEVIKSVKMLKDSGFKVKYFIIGKTNYIHYGLKLKILVKKLKLEDNVIFLGYLPFSLVKKYVDDSNIVIQPRKYSTEGASGSLVFCMCRGKPVISNDIDYAKEYIINNKTGFLIKNESKLYFKIISNLISDKNKLTEIQRNVLNWSKNNLDWKIISRKHVEIYKGILK